MEVLLFNFTLIVYHYALRYYRVITVPISNNLLVSSVQIDVRINYNFYSYRQIKFYYRTVIVWYNKKILQFL